MGPSLLLLGISEAEESRRLLELNDYVVYITNMLAPLGQDLASSAMILIHKLLKIKSLKGFISKLKVVAVACVFLAAKDRGKPIHLSLAARILYELEKTIKMREAATSAVTHSS